MVTGLPLVPVGISAHAYLTSGEVLVMNGSSQPPSKIIATCFLPRASPHQLEPRSLAVIARPFLNWSMYHWTAVLLASVSICSWDRSSLTTEPPCAYRNARPRSRPGLKHIGALSPLWPLSEPAVWTSSSSVFGGVLTRSLLYASAIVFVSFGRPYVLPSWPLKIDAAPGKNALVSKPDFET